MPDCRRCLIAVALFAFMMIGSGAVLAGPWPQWRGPGGDGVTVEADAPLRWDAANGVAWRVRLPGPGNGSPIAIGGRVFLNQSLKGGAERAVMCFDRQTGKLLWQKAIPGDPDEPTHRTNPLAPTTPASDGQRVYAWHGTAGLVAYDMDGGEVWRRDLGRYRIHWGMGPSPVLHGDALILYAGPGDHVNLFAIDCATGKTLWKTPLPAAQNEFTTPGDQKQWKGGWASPLVAGPGKAAQIILPLPQALRAFHPETGAELWRCEGLSDLAYTAPLVSDDHIVAMSGYAGPAFGMKRPAPGQTGDLTASHRLWRDDRTTQRIGSGVMHHGKMFIVNENGVAQCTDPATGKDVWKARLPDKCWGSLVLVKTADGDRLYITDVKAVTHVIKPGDAFELLASNPLDGGQNCRATPAFSDGQIFVRTYQYLYCIGDPRPVQSRSR